MGSIRPSPIPLETHADESIAAGQRDRKLALLLLAAGLVGSVLLFAWVYLGWMDWGMRHMEVGANMWIMPRMVGWNAADVALVFLMWTVMMAAMMLPSALPVILLVAKVSGSMKPPQPGVGLTGAFIAGYLLAWSGFSLAATLFQWGLLESALVTPMMQSAKRALSATMLITAGIYQFTPLKNACLWQCQSPLSLIMEVAAGPRRALKIGLRHGLYCVGCCWALMGLLFVTGVMNLLWVMIIAGYVAIEKLLPATRWLSRTAGVLLGAAGLWFAISDIASAGLLQTPGASELLLDSKSRVQTVVEFYGQGFKRQSIPKLEVWRLANKSPPLYPTDPDIVAIATDAKLDIALPIFALGDYLGLAQRILRSAKPANGLFFTSSATA
jgi:predicted metal-binding membrane protein